MFFVCYYQPDYSWDTSTERGTESFLSLEGAISFAKVWRNKGFICDIYQGIKLMN